MIACQKSPVVEAGDTRLVHQDERHGNRPAGVQGEVAWTRIAGKRLEEASTAAKWDFWDGRQQEFLRKKRDNRRLSRSGMRANQVPRKSEPGMVGYGGCCVTPGK